MIMYSGACAALIVLPNPNGVLPAPDRSAKEDAPPYPRLFLSSLVLGINCNNGSHQNIPF